MTFYGTVIYEAIENMTDFIIMDFIKIERVIDGIKKEDVITNE